MISWAVQKYQSHHLGKVPNSWWSSRFVCFIPPKQPRLLMASDSQAVDVCLLFQNPDPYLKQQHRFSHDRCKYTTLYSWSWLFSLHSCPVLYRQYWCHQSFIACSSSIPNFKSLWFSFWHDSTSAVRFSYINTDFKSRICSMGQAKQPSQNLLSIPVYLPTLL